MNKNFRINKNENGFFVEALNIQPRITSLIRYRKSGMPYKKREQRPDADHEWVRVVFPPLVSGPLFNGENMEFTEPRLVTIEFFDTFEGALSVLNKL